MRHKRFYTEYLALLRFRFWRGWWDKFEVLEPLILDDIKREISKFLAGETMGDAHISAKIFLEKLHTHIGENLKKDKERKELLDLIEKRHYSRFRDVCHKYFKRRLLIGSERGSQEILRVCGN